jgi:hypothetical protein
MKKHRPNVWVVRVGGSGYSVKAEGTRRPLIKPVTQRAASRIAREIARAYRSELFIQNAVGRIRARDSHGFDSPRRKG